MSEDSSEEIHELPVTYNALSEGFRETGLSANIFVLYVDQTSYNDDSNSEDEFLSDGFTSGVCFVMYIQVHNGVSAVQSRCMCMEFRTPGDQLENFTIHDFARMILSIDTMFPWCNVTRNPGLEVPANEELFEPFFTGITFDPDYCYDSFVSYDNMILIFSKTNLDENLIQY